MLPATERVGNLPSRHVIKVGFALALVILAGIALFSYTSIKRYNEHAKLVEHTREVLLETDGVLSDLKDVETSLRGYVISGQESFLDLYRVALASIPGRMARLARLTADDPGQQQRIGALRALVDKRIDEAVALLQLRQRSKLIFPDEVRERTGVGKSVMDTIRELTRDVRKQEEALLQIRSKKSLRSARRTIAVIVAGNAAGFSILIIAFVLLRREIAQRAQAHQSAQKYAAETEDLYNNAPCGYHSLDKDGNFVRINDTELSWLGYSRDEVIGKLRFSDIVTPASREKFSETFPRFKAEGQLANAEFEFIRKNGTAFPVSLSATALRDREGNFVMSRTTVFDMTNLKNAERALQETNIFLDTIVENIPSMIFVKEAASLRFARINRAEEAFLGIPRNELLGKNDHELFPVEQADFFRAKDREVLASYGTMDIGEEQLTTLQGVRILHTRKIALRDIQGQPRYLLGISEDITERKRVEKQIQALNRDLEIRANELEAANKELESFSYSVSHDLRSPLRAIDGFARIFEEDYRDKLDDEARRLLQVIRDSSQKMEQLIDDLLTFSRLGRKPIEAARVDMHNVIDDALEEVRAGSHTTHTKIVIGNLPPAWGDTALLKQVWVNLLSNAIKYSGKNDSAKVEIGCLESDAPGRSGTTYFVRDNGVGFDMRYYEKLFGVFQRLHSSAEFGGTGVGLAIVHRLVRRHGGRVWAEAVVNEGATFYFSLPGEA
ncbi:MAG TPA: CHASE3 domain-containing protein [Burkholderiales bacterium]|nr:CHASE3 domain-containing protein [Burkholderiales bacterium]